jgi:hypothetical protein
MVTDIGTFVPTLAEFVLEGGEPEGDTDGGTGSAEGGDA